MNDPEREELKAAIGSAVKGFQEMNADIAAMCHDLNETFDDDSALTSAIGVAQRSMQRLQNMVVSRLDGLLTNKDA